MKKTYQETHKYYLKCYFFKGLHIQSHDSVIMSIFDHNYLVLRSRDVGAATAGYPGAVPENFDALGAVITVVPITAQQEHRVAVASRSKIEI